MSYIRTTIAVSVHRASDNPIFGEGATHVTLEDECGGPYFILKQSDDNAKFGEVKMDLDELREIMMVAEELIAGWPKEEK
jgi:hypothetical protein